MSALPYTVISLNGNIDVNSSDALRRQVMDAVTPDQPRIILLDCSEVTFLDSSGLSAMVMALKLARESQNQLAVAAVPTQMMMLFRLTGMDKVFKVYEDRTAFETAMTVPS